MGSQCRLGTRAASFRCYLLPYRRQRPWRSAHSSQTNHIVFSYLFSLYFPAKITWRSSGEKNLSYPNLARVRGYSSRVRRYAPKQVPSCLWVNMALRHYLLWGRCVSRNNYGDFPEDKDTSRWIMIWRGAESCRGTEGASRDWETDVGTRARWLSP